MHICMYVCMLVGIPAYIYVRAYIRRTHDIQTPDVCTPYVHSYVRAFTHVCGYI